jgi:hypothetical protein
MKPVVQSPQSSPSPPPSSDFGAASPPFPPGEGESSPALKRTAVGAIWAARLGSVRRCSPLAPRPSSLAYESQR